MRTTYLKIYLDALRHNLRAIRALVPKHTETVAVVKANSYGYGAVQVAAMAMEEGYEALAVAVTSEAKQLREAGFKCPIYLLGLLMPEEYEDAFNTDSIIPVCESTDLQQLDETAFWQNRQRNGSCRQRHEPYRRTGGRCARIFGGH